MGTSTDAIIAYGFDLGEDGDLPEKLQELMEVHDHDVDSLLAADLGISLPEYVSGGDYKKYSGELDAAMAQIKIDMVRHCSFDYPMYFLAVRGSDKEANHGHATPVDPIEMAAVTADSEAIEMMRAFCERHGIEWQQPKWHVFSMRG